MTALVTPAEMRAAEAAALASGTTERELMRRAAEGIAGWLDAAIRLPHQRHAVALVGPGNNGGDALVALALLHARGWRVSSVPLGRSTIGDLPAPPADLAAIACAELSVLDEADVILDGVYGIGSRLALPEPVQHAFHAARDVRRLRGTPLVALDVPSGIDAGTGAASDDAFPADVTLCLGLPKRGLVREPAASYVGELILLPIAIPTPDIAGRETVITVETVRRALPQRGASAHKSTAGTVLIVGGAPAYYGAPRLAAEAAALVGAGLVALAVPTSLVPVIAAQVPETVFVPLDDEPARSVEQILDFAEARSATLRSLVIGPGLGRGDRAGALLTRLLGPEAAEQLPHLTELPTVIDADALNWLASRPDWPHLLTGRQVVLTPHAGEMARLLGVPTSTVLADPIGVAKRAAEDWQQYVVLKTGYAPVADPSCRVRIAPRATPELATAGTGDVLAGMIGGLLAQRLAPGAAATTAIWLGAMAGRSAREEFGVASVTARALLAHLPRVMQRLEPVVRHP
jgi:hydroxyethylthiazole kinase-like uncharacterized protein yjeF